MRILHVFPKVNLVVSSTFIKFAKENFSSLPQKESHEFAINCTADELHDNELKQNVFFISYDKLISIADGFDKIILHSILQLTTLNKIKFLLTPKLMNSIIWVAWGGDLYKYSSSKSIKSRLKEMINYRFIKGIKHFVGIFPPDIDYFKKVYDTGACTYYASYTGALDNPIYKEQRALPLLEQKIANNETINIMVGHSSTKVLNHIDVLEDLFRYKDENIRIYIPLSYGDMEYGNLVEKKAVELYGDKVVYIRSIMNKQDYMKFLSEIDIAVFNTHRQIGLGNINPLIYMGKKLYMPEGSVMYEFFHSEGISISSCSEIKNLSYDDFTKPVQINQGRKYIMENVLNKEKKVELWRKVFDAAMK
ncbi:MAG TPA: hypothetical protein DIW17_19740 [Clostridiales bacterium]|nr:hypothetical protein [Clostridiales bacterium]